MFGYFSSRCEEITCDPTSSLLAPFVIYFFWFLSQDAMEKAIKNKVAKAVVPAIDVMFQALRSVSSSVDAVNFGLKQYQR